MDRLTEAFTRAIEQWLAEHPATTPEQMAERDAELARILTDVIVAAARGDLQ
jgi:hypothetical protein